ncbi:MAG: J domain-containing protein [Dehalococcoidia bacterium]
MPTYNLSTNKTPDETMSELRYCFEGWRDAELISARNLKDANDTAEVVFEFHGETVRVQYGLQQRYRDNLRAVYLTLEGLRLAYRRGLGDLLTNTVSQMLQLGAAAVHRDPYELLGVRPDTPLPVAEAAYKTLAKALHPDAGGSDEDMRELNDAIQRVRRDRA